METKIIKEYHEQREGNDCLIKVHYTLLDVCGVYLVVSLTEYNGWMGYQADSSVIGFVGKTDAIEYYNKLSKGRQLT